MSSLPVIDVSELVHRSDGGAKAAEDIGRACRDWGFFYVTGHGIDPDLQVRLAALSREFFALDTATKLEIRMERGGRAWRGYFPVGDELTSGIPDVKEGLYFGAELEPSDPRVRAGLPLHGANLFPDAVPGLRDAVLDYIDAVTELGHALMRGVSLSLGFPEDHFRARYTDDPTVLFRIFHYPPVELDPNEPRWGVGEHTDYGLLTILKQDDVGGLQVRSKSAWIDAPPIEDGFVCNIGDMLDRMTGGLYRSTPHRVRNVSGRDRYSFPFFFDPGWNAPVEPLAIPSAVRARSVEDDDHPRWDGTDLQAFEGTYGQYLLQKVSRVFPQLSESIS